MKFRVFLVVLSCIVSVVTGLVISRGGANAPAAKGHAQTLIGLSMDTLKEERWQGDRDQFVKRVTELGGQTLVQAANSDDTRQIQDIESLISNKVDALVIVPHNGAAMAKAVTLAHDAGIPVMAYDRLITGSDLDLYITFDNVKVGELQAQFLLDHLPPSGKLRLVRIYGSKTDNNAFLFKRGQDNILDPAIKKGIVEVVHEDWAQDWTLENAKKITNAAVTRIGTNFDAVLASNDTTAGGAIQSLSEEGLAGKIIVTGQDADLAACQRIAAGTQAMTIYKPTSKLARGAAEIALKLARGKPIIAREVTENQKIEVPSVLLDVVPVTKENLVDTVIKDGYHTYDDVYKGVPEDQRPKRP